jgi:hypothetical protein
MEAELEELVWERASDRCEYCRLPLTCTPLTHEIDHSIALKHRGPTITSNLALACFGCNNHKGTNIADLDPLTGAIVRLFHSRRHKWSRDFSWNGATLVGRTAIGRATITVLEINLPYRVALRQALIDEGVFPPLS